MGITESLRRILIFSANKIKKSSESGSKQRTQLNIIVKMVLFRGRCKKGCNLVRWGMKIFW